MNKPNIVLIVLDTCRKDLFSEAISKGFMPNLKSLLIDFNIFDQNISPSPWTTPSHVSLFTGLYPSEHKVHEDAKLKQSSVIMENIKNFDGKLLPEILRERGYSTYAFVANPNLAPRTGFERGFDYFFYSDMFSDIFEKLKDFKGQLARKYPKDYDAIIELSNNFSFSRIFSFAKQGFNFLKLPYLYINYLTLMTEIKKSKYPLVKGGKNIINNVINSYVNEPFFIFINFMETHDPYRISTGELFSGEGTKMLRYLAGDSILSCSALNEFKSIYLEELRVVDRYMMEIFKKLKMDNSYDETVIIITADHGQSFGEDHFYGHGVFLSDVLVRVPLLVKLPWSEKISQNSGYQSLVNVFEFILSCSSGIVDGKLLTSDVVFSESFGIQDDYVKILNENKEIINSLLKLDHRRLALYSLNSMVCFDINDELVTISKTVHTSNGDEESINPIIDEAMRFLGQRFIFNYLSRGLR